MERFFKHVLPMLVVAMFAFMLGVWVKQSGKDGIANLGDHPYAGHRTGTFHNLESVSDRNASNQVHPLMIGMVDVYVTPEGNCAMLMLVTQDESQEYEWFVKGDVDRDGQVSASGKGVSLHGALHKDEDGMVSGEFTVQAQELNTQMSVRLPQ